MKLTLSYLCSHPDLPLFRHTAALAHLDFLPFHNLVIGIDGSALFPFGKGSSDALVNCSLCGNQATLFSLPGPVCSSFFAEACTILKAVCWCRQHQQVCHFSSLRLSLCPQHTVLSFDFSFTSNPLTSSGTFGRNCLLSPPVLSGCHGSPDIYFSRGTTQLMSWPGAVHYSCALQSLVVSLLYSLESISLFSRTKGVLSHLNFLTYKPRRCPLRSLCSLVTLAVSFLVLAAVDTAFC